MVVTSKSGAVLGIQTEKNEIFWKNFFPALEGKESQLFLMRESSENPEIALSWNTVSLPFWELTF